MRESMCDTQSKMASDSSNEGTTDKPVVLGNGRRENGENYQRALTLLNEAVGILVAASSSRGSQYLKSSALLQFWKSFQKRRLEMFRLVHLAVHSGSPFVVVHGLGISEMYQPINGFSVGKCMFIT